MFTVSLGNRTFPIFLMLAMTKRAKKYHHHLPTVTSIEDDSRRKKTDRLVICATSVVLTKYVVFINFAHNLAVTSLSFRNKLFA